MDKNKHVGFLIAGVAAAIALLAYFFPKHSVTTAVVAPEATVPSQLLTSETQSSNDQSPTAQATPSRVVVYICGEVKRPGVYEMTNGARVSDGISRAGGALADADLEQLNLAQPLADAMKVDVPKKGEHLAFTAFGNEQYGQPQTHRARHGGRSSHKLQPGQTLDINTASETELTQLPGVGPSLAARIVEYRTENGPFQSIDDLQNVSGIGPSKFDKMAPYVRL
jgi:competence protein ComEA